MVLNSGEQMQKGQFKRRGRKKYNKTERERETETEIRLPQNHKKAFLEFQLENNYQNIYCQQGATTSNS